MWDNTMDRISSLPPPPPLQPPPKKTALVRFLSFFHLFPHTHTSLTRSQSRTFTFSGRLAMRRSLPPGKESTGLMELGADTAATATPATLSLSGLHWFCSTKIQLPAERNPESRTHGSPLATLGNLQKCGSRPVRSTLTTPLEGQERKSIGRVEKSSIINRCSRIPAAQNPATQDIKTVVWLKYIQVVWIMFLRVAVEQPSTLSFAHPTSHAPFAPLNVTPSPHRFATISGTGSKYRA